MFKKQCEIKFLTVDESGRCVPVALVVIRLAPGPRCSCSFEQTSHSLRRSGISLSAPGWSEQSINNDAKP
jgi:hypothetical protein